MAQQLYFEPVWERTISEKDKLEIEGVFLKGNHNDREGLRYAYIRHAINHRGHLLCTVILHNYSNRAYTFQDKKVTLLDTEGRFTSGTFTLPIDIPAQRSMPWTFIFTNNHVGEINVAESSLLL